MGSHAWECTIYLNGPCNCGTGDMPRGPSVAAKRDAGKLRYDLIPAWPLAGLAGVYTIGANKYGDDNYLKGGGLNWNRVVGAMLRHIAAWRMGESHDVEDGQHHLSSVAWCAFTLMMYEEYGLGKDDRYPIPDEEEEPDAT